MLEKPVIIIGGGPAGASCAWRLKQAGVDALIIDKECFPRTKLCAGWVTPDVFRLLEIDPSEYPEGLVRFDRLICHFLGTRLPVRTRQYSIRRYEFDAWMLKRANVPVARHRVRSIRKEGGHYVVDERYRARYLVGAGGTHCPVYRSFFRERHPRSPLLRVSTVEKELAAEIRDPNCYLWFFENRLPGYAWYVPKANGYINVGIGGKDAVLRRRGETINTHWSRFKKKLDTLGLAPAALLNGKGHIYYLRKPRPALQSGRAFITGDAAGLSTCDMGEGIAPSIQSGIRAADAIITGRPYRMPKRLRYSWPAIVSEGLKGFFTST